jgi:hypothetical protein
LTNGLRSSFRSTIGQAPCWTLVSLTTWIPSCTNLIHSAMLVVMLVQTDAKRGTKPGTIELWACDRYETNWKGTRSGVQARAGWVCRGRKAYVVVQIPMPMETIVGQRFVKSRHHRFLPVHGHGLNGRQSAGFVQRYKVRSAPRWRDPRFNCTARPPPELAREATLSYIRCRGN